MQHSASCKLLTFHSYRSHSLKTGSDNFFLSHSWTENHKQLTTLVRHAELPCLFQIGHVLNTVLCTANWIHPKLSSVMTSEEWDYTVDIKAGQWICSVNSGIFTFILNEILNCNTVMAVAAHSITLLLNTYYHTCRPTKVEGSFVNYYWQ
jgi:hypothetical protein